MLQSLFGGAILCHYCASFSVSHCCFWAIGNNVAKLERELRNLKRDIRKEIRVLNSSVEFVSKQCEDIKSERERVKAANAAFKAAQEPLLKEILALKK